MTCTSYGQVTVTDDLNNLSGFNNAGGFTANGTSASAFTQSQQMTMTTGVLAPVSIGDYVTAQYTGKVTVGTQGMLGENRYCLVIGITGDNTGGSGKVSSSWTRRSVPGTIWGHNISTNPATTPGTWQFDGWNNNSEIGLSAATGATSDWFTAELTVTKAASGYDVEEKYYDNLGAEQSTTGVVNTPLNNGLDSASTWYLTVGTDWQFHSTYGDCDEFEIDQVELTSSIPEPSSFALLGLGVLGLLARRRR